MLSKLLELQRRWKPILLLFRRCAHKGVPVWASVTRYDDVREVLERDDDFSVAIYGQRMKATTGEFFLGFGRTDRYERESGLVRRLLRADDTERIAEFTAAESRRILRGIASNRTSFDLVADFANLVPALAAADYVGIDPEDAGRLHAAFQATSVQIFSFLTSSMTDVAAARAAATIRDVVAANVAARRATLAAGGHARDDVLGRLLSAQSSGDPTFDDEGLVRTLSGILSGFIIPTTGSFVRSVGRILDLPPAQRRPLEEAAEKDADDVVRKYVLEAVRFDPNPGVLYRYCERDCVLAEGTKRETRIPAGTKVVVWLSSAARDPEVVPQPGEFRPDRPAWQYPQFGFGQHRCLGEEISLVVHREMLKALCCLRGLRRDPSAKPIYGPGLRGGYPKHFPLQFDRLTLDARAEAAHRAKSE